MSKELKKCWESIKIDIRWIIIQSLINWIIVLLPNTEEGRFWITRIIECLHDSHRKRND